MKFMRLITETFSKNTVIKTTLQAAVAAMLYVLTALYTQAGEVDVINVTIESLGEGKFRINATLDHGDTGWDHYANRWDVLNESGEVIGVRELAHPHVNEMPFTRSVTISIAASVKTITVRANDSVHETGGKTFDLAVPHP